jgi:predicted transcriptional regulator
MISVADTISAISEEKALSLFQAVALSENDNTNVLITKLRLNSRQRYSRIEKLMHVGLIRRINGKYSLTSFGRIVFSILIKVENAIKYYWKLKAIDSILLSSDRKELPPHEYQMIIYKLIDNHEIKAILVSDEF